MFKLTIVSHLICLRHLILPMMHHSDHTFSSGTVADIKVTSQNFEDAFKKVRPSVSKKVSLSPIKAVIQNIYYIIIILF